MTGQTGALIQIAANGEMDKYLYGTPEVTYWKSSSLRSTVFSLENQMLTFNSGYGSRNKSVCTFNRSGDLVHSMFLVVDLPGIASVGEVKGQTGANLRSYVAEDGRGNKLSGFPNVFNLKFETAAYDAIEAAGVKAGDYVAQEGGAMGIVVDMKPYKRGSTSAKETFSVRVRVINKVSFLDFHGAMLHYEAAKGLPVSLPPVLKT